MTPLSDSQIVVAASFGVSVRREHVLEEAVRAAVVEGRSGRGRRRRSSTPKSLAVSRPDGVGEIVVVDREVDALLALQALEDRERGAWPVVGRHADEELAHAHRVSGLAAEPAVVVDLVQVELLRLLEISVQRLFGTAAAIAPAGRYEERCRRAARRRRAHPTAVSASVSPRGLFVRKTHGPAG